MYKRGDSPYWWYNLPNPHGGERIKGSTGETDKRKAQEIHDQKKAELWRVKATGRQFYDALALWISDKSRSINQLNNIKQIQREYKNRPLTEVTGASVLTTWGHKTPGTYNKLANIVRAALNLAASRQWIDSPDKIIRKKEAKKRIRFLTHKEAETLLGHLPDHLRDMAIFALATGLRWANVSCLKWSEIDIRQRIAWIHPDETKSGKTISVPLSDNAIDVLKRKPGKKDAFVFTYHGAPIASPKTAWKTACQKSGIEDFRWHDLRHTWASWHIQNGTPLAVLKELGGWSSTELVERYAHLAPNHIAQYANNVPLNTKPKESNVVEINPKKRSQ